MKQRAPNHEFVGNPGDIRKHVVSLRSSLIALENVSDPCDVVAYSPERCTVTGNLKDPKVTTID